jgi:hypothetical protein
MRRERAATIFDCPTTEQHYPFPTYLPRAVNRLRGRFLFQESLTRAASLPPLGSTGSVTNHVGWPSGVIISIHAKTKPLVLVLPTDQHRMPPLPCNKRQRLPIAVRHTSSACACRQNQAAKMGSQRGRKLRRVSDQRRNR